MRFIDIVRDANSNLFRSKIRTILTVVAIFIGGFTLTVTNGIGSGVSEYIDKQLGNLGAEDVLIVQQQAEDPFTSGPQKFDEDQALGSIMGGFGPMIPMLSEQDLESIESTDGILSVEPLLGASPDFIVGPNDERYKLSISAFVEGTNLDLAAGELPDNKSERNEIMLTLDYVAALGFDSADSSLGEPISIGISSASGERQEVIATVVSVQENTLMSMGGLVVNDALIRRLVAVQAEGAPSTAPESHMAAIARVAVDSTDDDVQTIKSSLADKGYDAQTVQDQIGVLKQIISAITTVLNIFAVIALVAASFGIVNTLLMSVQERTKEIGLMKAMGLGRRKIFLLFSIEAILIGFWGSLLGSLAGVGAGLVANKIASDTFLKDMPGFDLTSFSFVSVAIVMGIIMAIAFVAGTMPARRASLKDPIEALRYE